ncbi:mavicyanin-like [Coffea eugenioides]|uniref:mavicyanin-like n=1 Tax=Coffea eugenioides TaxID=49369 RepID=UPI000F608B87|nr:mavicyanin-like [Coffea eugenioides]
MAPRSVLCCVCALVIPVIFFSATPTMVVAAEEFKVGDALGWRQPTLNETDMYNLWASRRRFHVGDSLRFEYTNDSVVVVDKWGFYHCNTSSPITAYTDGNNTLITLDAPGPMYFISGDHHHCKEGQRLLIDVFPLHPRSHSPPAIARPPQSFPGISPAPSPLSNSGPTISSADGVASISVVSVLVAFVATALMA